MTRDAPDDWYRLSATAVRVPPVGPDAIYCTLFTREAGFAELAEAELRSLADGHVVEPGVYLSASPIRWAEAGFGTGGGRQLAFATTLEELRAQVAALDLRTPTFGIKVRRVPRAAQGSQAAKKIIADCVTGDVDFAEPRLSLFLIVSHRGFRLLLEGDPGDGRWRDSAHKPHNLMIAIPVRIGQAMLNLTARPGDSLLDPFCGSGTIPLLAALAGLTAYGSDISAAWVDNAAANIAHFGAQATLRRVDARDATQRADCIVSNPPYGVFSHLEADALHAVLRNLKRLSRRVTLVSSEHLEDALVAAGYAISRVLTVEPERFERFIYLTSVPLA
ncbi:MAG: hypothetical protein CVU56_28015 [Deltaproteobacteria bacterium HGW-Deltaproteobacteria-14]|jgi:predicted RNA methylase|nr:MAG: hypothetical protein CVU56_28015 [Deltaproteobacteria bacterium HGW-Deltaproteobacteria-14]